MKQSFCVLLVLLLLLSFCCCSQTDEPSQTVRFYYAHRTPALGSTNGVISFETREIDGMNASELLAYYLQGPVNDYLRHPFPQNVTLLSYSQTGNTLHITFNEKLAELDKRSLLTACACICLSCKEIFGTETVVFSANGKQLNGADTYMLNVRDILISDDRIS